MTTDLRALPIPLWVMRSQRPTQWQSIRNGLCADSLNAQQLGYMIDCRIYPCSSAENTDRSLTRRVYLRHDTLAGCRGNRDAVLGRPAAPLIDRDQLTR
jgi:hypothetical protein